MNRKRILFIAAFVIPGILMLKTIIEGSFPFGYDIARDFLLALDNIKKPRLIGSPTGIPGVFYGPYWIWLLSGILWFTKDPRWVTFFLLFIPYFVLFPTFLFKLKYLFGQKILLILWLLFIFSFSQYTNSLWNPYVAPLLFLALCVLVFSNMKWHKKGFVAGILCGFLLNVHISFSLGITIGVALFFFLDTIFPIMRMGKPKFIFLGMLKSVSMLSVFLTGLFLVFTPFFIFEYRHNFLQMNALRKTMQNAIFYNTAAVGQTGLKTHEILSSLFIEKLSTLLSVTTREAYGLYLLAAGYILFLLFKGKLLFSALEKRFLFFLFLVTSGILTVFLSSKNPVWSYHFIGTEIIALLMIGVFAKKCEIFAKYLLIWTLIILSANSVGFFISFSENPRLLSSLATKQYIIDSIYKDASGEKFSISVYSPSIYTYDYDYLFLWLSEEKYSYIPETGVAKGKYTYLIIPKTSDAIYADFINYKTPVEKYTTVKEWLIPDGTVVVKRSPL